MKHTTLLSLFTLLPLAVSAADVTWTGGGDGSSWDDPANWGGAVPATGDTAVFASSLTLNTSDASTISMGDVAVADGATVIVSAKADLASDVTWTVGEGGELRFSAAVSGAGKIVKNGAGEVRLNADSNRSGDTTVNEGIFTVSRQKQLAGSIVVGDGVHDAMLRLVWTASYNFNLYSSNPSFLVRNHGVIDYESLAGGTGELSLNITVVSVTVEEGGVLKTGRIRFGMGYGENVVCAGTIKAAGESKGGFHLNGSTIRIPDTLDHAPTLEAHIVSQVKWVNGIGNVYATFNVPDLPGVPVDLNLPNAINRGWDGRDGIDKQGAGTMRISSSLNDYGGVGTSGQGYTRILGGTLLVDNESGSGTGYSTVSVAAGTTLGGKGFIGGYTEDWVVSGRQTSFATNAYVTAAGTDGNPAVIAPGTIDDATGAHVCGTLTVGSADQASQVTLGNYTTLRVSLGAPNLCDCLRVYGKIHVGATGTSLVVSVPDDPTTMRPGEYVVASATEGIIGAFASQTLSSNKVLLSITENEIVVTVPHPETIVIIL